MATQTPWGKSDSSTKIARGIVSYSTPSHGGIHVSKGLLAKMPEPFRKTNGWYEEDCEWCMVALSFQQFFSDENVKAAHQTAKQYFPDQYEAWMRVSDPSYEIPLEESYAKRKKDFWAKNQNNWVATSALSVEGGMVKVWAILGSNYGDRKAKERCFLIPESDYSTPFGFWFVVDVLKYEEVCNKAA
jgi:hypothetical protein